MSGGGRWGFDLESNGLLDTIHTIWCIVCREVDTGEVRQFGPSEIQGALELLSAADEIIGHNIINYDIPATPFGTRTPKSLIPWFSPVWSLAIYTMTTQRNSSAVLTFQRS